MYDNIKAFSVISYLKNQLKLHNPVHSLHLKSLNSTNRSRCTTGLGS